MPSRPHDHRETGPPLGPSAWEPDTGLLVVTAVRDKGSHGTCRRAELGSPRRPRWADAMAPVGPVGEARFGVPTAGRLGIRELAVVAPSALLRVLLQHVSPIRWRSRPEFSVRRCRSERRGDVPQREIWLHVAAGPLPLGQRDVLLDEWLVRDLAQQVADDVEPASLRWTWRPRWRTPGGWPTTPTTSSASATTWPPRASSWSKVPVWPGSSTPTRSPSATVAAGRRTGSSSPWAATRDGCPLLGPSWP
jgi:hypothetical protein